MLLLLCVDGLCPEQAFERGYPTLPYERKLAIPPELYYEGVPHTLKVWPSMFHGLPVEFNLKKTINKIYDRDNLGYKLRRGLIDLGAKRLLASLKVDYGKYVKPAKRQYHIQPFIHNIDTVFDHYQSATWNIPGINPECVVGFPTAESLLPYIKRQYQNWKNLTYGMASNPKTINAAYTNILDGLSHRKQPTDPFYLDLQNHIDKLRKTADIDIMLVSDHGSTLEGEHTDHAYLGCTAPLTAETVTDVRYDIERILGTKTSKERIYWDSRYKKGGSSGKGSIGKHREWKQELIRKHSPQPLPVIDVGCGDLSFWNYKPPTDYTGIDISSTIIEKNMLAQPSTRFINASAEKYIPGIKAPVVICFDLLFHIMDGGSYTQILSNLCKYSTDLIFIYTWIKNPLGKRESDGKYQTYRNFEGHLNIFENAGFQLIEKTPNPHDDAGGMYVFRNLREVLSESGEAKLSGDVS